MIVNVKPVPLDILQLREICDLTRRSSDLSQCDSQVVKRRSNRQQTPAIAVLTQGRTVKMQTIRDKRKRSQQRKGIALLILDGILAIIWVWWMTLIYK